MKNWAIGLIRTGVAGLVGSAMGWLAARGIDVDPETQTALIVGMAGTATGIYQGVVTALQKRWKWLGFLLAIPREPTYEEKPKPVGRRSYGM